MNQTQLKPVKKLIVCYLIVADDKKVMIKTEESLHFGKVVKPLSLKSDKEITKKEIVEKTIFMYAMCH